MADTVQIGRDAPRDEQDAPRGWSSSPAWGPAGAPPGYVSSARSGEDALPPVEGAAASPAGPPLATAPTRAFTRARAGLVALVVLAVEVVLIAAGANQAMTKHLARYAADHPTTFAGNAAHAALAYGWRVTPRAGARHLWWGELAAIGTVFVLSALLAFVLVRGAVTFWRALIGLWLAVIVATEVGVVVGDLVARIPLTGDRVTATVFGASTADAFTAGIGLGLVTALIGAIVAVATRRTVQVVVPAEVPDDERSGVTPETPPPFFGEQPDPRPRLGVSGAGASGAGIADARTQAYPVITPSGSREPAATGDTTELPAAETTTSDAPTSDAPTPDSAAKQPAQSTRWYPVPPDDEQLGHDPE